MSDKVIQDGDREKVIRTWQHILVNEKVSKGTEELIVKTLVLLETTDGQDAKTAAAKDKECQKRVERIFGEIEDENNSFRHCREGSSHYCPNCDNRLAIGVLDRFWQALKEGEGLTAHQQCGEA